jgi:ubiquinone/menaquinone biosynthesis C-methylase UbiE|tara:strand:+ start:711 stop:1484 length:774 start_codon:yes stop_codon:yes gene_type:complete
MENRNYQQQVYQIWDDLWAQRRKAPYFIIYLKNFSFSRLIANEFKKKIGELNGKKVIEIGCGTGTTSLRFSKLGAKVSLLDISLNSIMLSKSIFKYKNMHAFHFNASMFELPLKNKQFDIVWNAGVLEHFEKEDQKKALLEMKRICKAGGTIMTFNPSERSSIYKRAKAHAEKKGTWQAGYEMPIKSFKSLFMELNLIMIEEYHIGFLTQFQYLKYYFPTKTLRYIFFGVWEVITNLFYTLDKYEGHFLVSIARYKE